MSESEPDIYDRIHELEAQLASVDARLATHARSTDSSAGCGNPAHEGIAAKVASQEALLARTKRGRKTSQRLAVGRGDRLDVEIARVKKEVARLEPITLDGDRALLARLRASQQRLRVLQLKAQAPTVAIVPASARLSLGGVERSPSRTLSGSWLAWISGAVTTVFAAGATAPLAVGLLATLTAAVALGELAFPGARRDLVTADTIYGERWEDVRSIEFRSDGTLVVATDAHTHRFDERSVGYFDVVRLALAAAARHAISVRGTPPELSSAG